jgi:hypothetical protein
LMVQEGKNPGYILKSTLTDMINEAYNHGWNQTYPAVSTEQ